METFMYILLGAGGLFILVVIFVTFSRQTPSRYRKQIVEALRAKGHSLMSIKAPNSFDTGPFPKFEVNLQPVHIETRVLGTRGEKTTYGIVKYKTQSGEEKESWVKIRVVAFTVVGIEWKPEL